MTGDDISERAERLRILLTLAGEEPALAAADRDRLGVVESLDMYDRYLLDHEPFTGDDVRLAVDLLRPRTDCATRSGRRGKNSLDCSPAETTPSPDSSWRCMARTRSTRRAPASPTSAGHTHPKKENYMAGKIVSHTAGGSGAIDGFGSKETPSENPAPPCTSASRLRRPLAARRSIASAKASQGSHPQAVHPMPTSA